MKFLCTFPNTFELEALRFPCHFQLLWVVFPPSKSEIETAITQEFFCIVGLRDMTFIALNDSHPLGFRVQFDVSPGGISGGFEASEVAFPDPCRVHDEVRAASRARPVLHGCFGRGSSVSVFTVAPSE